MERLQKAIASFGYCSRRKAEELIVAGKVEVNGVVIKELGTKVSGNDTITVEGNTLNKHDEKIYYLLNKPRGVITSSQDEKGRKTVLDLVPNDIRVYPVGRLDYDTTGVLLLTNDGELTNLLIHPKSNIEKMYIAKVEGFVTKENIVNLCRGVIIDGRKTAKAKARLKKYDKKTNTSLVELTIHEGRNHQVKKMFESLGYPVIKLKREKFSFLTTDGLKSGEYRYLNIKEVKKLYSEVKES